MTIVKHTVHLNLKGVSEKNIMDMDVVIAPLKDCTGFGILSYGGLMKAHDNDDMKKGLNQNFTHSFEMIFSTIAHLDYYLPHVGHMAVVSELVNLGLNTEDKKNICAIDVDSRLPRALAQYYFSQFKTNHRCNRIKDALNHIEDKVLQSEAENQLSQIANRYLSEKNISPAEKRFWENL
ncbi:MAG: hypothetical protein AAGA27_04280 [Pseudomonadota bacterium]